MIFVDKNIVLTANMPVVYVSEIGIADQDIFRYVFYFLNTLLTC